MGRPNKSKISRRNNLTRTATHRCHRATIDRTPEEVTGSGNIAKYIEEACVWADGDDDELAENAQQEVWSISSDSSSIAVLDSEEEDNTTNPTCTTSVRYCLKDWQAGINLSPMPEPQTSGLTSTGETRVQAGGEHPRLHRIMGRLSEAFLTLL